MTAPWFIADADGILVEFTVPFGVAMGADAGAICFGAINVITNAERGAQIPLEEENER